MKQFGLDKNGADCKDIRPHLKEIDSLFEISFNYDTEQYWIYFNGGLFRSVPWKELDGRTMEDIRKAYWTNVNGDPFAEVDENNARLEEAKEREHDELVRELAKDLRWAINKDF